VPEGTQLKIDTKARWAIAAILDIAIHENGYPVCLADISKRQRVSQSHLEHLFRRLRESGFVASTRGPGGGYRLIRRLATISVADVITSVDSHAFGSDPCHDTERCADDHGNAADALWCGLDDHLRNYLRTANLASVLANATEAVDLNERLAVVATIPCVEMALARHEDRPAATIA
jgi:Rrf2 family transcriptional regulator, iron-sulfur cluster assembly transcription factor